MLIVCDIDGTIAEPGERLKYLEKDPPDYESFYRDSFMDEPIKAICDLVHELEAHHEIIFCTGRTDIVRSKTENWIIENIGIEDFTLLMRNSGDERHDTIVKPELLSEHSLSPDNVWFIIEDRNCVVKKWRELGYTVIQPREGEF